MIQSQTKLKVTDNSGGKIVKCFKVKGGFQKKTAQLGEIIVVSVQKLRSKYKKVHKVKKGEVYQALIVRTKKGFSKKDGSRTFLFENSVILLNKQNNPIGTRILGPLPKILDKKRFQKIILTSSGVI